MELVAAGFLSLDLNECVWLVMLPDETAGKAVLFLVQVKSSLKKELLQMTS